MSGSRPDISVVVATRDRPAALERCLAALARQTAASLEVIVVDDDSDDPEIVRGSVARRCPGAHIVRGPGRGPAAARNAGVRATSGAVVCFTDDDCIPDPEWAERLRAACPDDGAAAAAGTTVSDPAAGRSAAASQLLTHVLQVASLGENGAGLGFAPTCNLACAAAIAHELPFDESFTTAAGEDREWCTRLARSGRVLAYAPDAIVVHRPQLGLIGLLRQQRRYGRGAVRFRESGGDLAGGSYYQRLVQECIRAGGRVSALVVLAECAVVAGAAGELARRSRR